MSGRYRSGPYPGRRTGSSRAVPHESGGRREIDPGYQDEQYPGYAGPDDYSEYPDREDPRSAGRRSYGPYSPRGEENSEQWVEDQREWATGYETGTWYANPDPLYRGPDPWYDPRYDSGFLPVITDDVAEAPPRPRQPTRRRRAERPRRRREPGTEDVVRASGVMAIGTLASRVTGMLRTLVQAYTLGAVALANSYNNANSLPNVVYNLLLGGILTSVIVPMLVDAAKRHTDRGEAYAQRMFTLVTIALLAVTVAATVAADAIVNIYRGSIQGAELHLMVIFAYFFIPQIFFYGISSLIGAILNSRGSFAAPMWTPVVNNVVVIAVLGMYAVIARPGVSPATITTGEVRLLGLGTTLGIVAQTVALIPSLRRVRFRWRPRFDFRRAEVREIRRMAGWMFVYIASTQVAFLVTTKVANHAIGARGYSDYTYAWQLFQMPYAVVGISVITALLPRMSAHAAERRLRLVRDDFSAGVRLSAVIVVPSSFILAALGPALGAVFFAHGATDLASAKYVGEVFTVFCLGLLPYMLFQLLLRLFYALHDSRTPALIGLLTMGLNIAANYIALAVLPLGQVVAGLGVGFGCANLLGAILAWRVLRLRLRSLDDRRVRSSLVRMHVAAAPAAIFALAVSVLASVVVGGGRLGAGVTLLLGGGGAVLLYLLFAKALQVAEVTQLASTFAARFRR